MINSIDNKNKIYVKVVSPNFELKYDHTIEEIEKKLELLIKYSDPESNQKTLFIWPEVCFTGYSFKEINLFKKLVAEKFNKNHLIVFGINTYNDELEIFNSLIIINNKFEIQYSYNKKKLVPFGEVLPFEVFLNKFGLKKITQGLVSFTKGDLKKNFSYNNLNLLPLICYEIIFPELIQNSSKKTNLLVNISEDGWFGNSIGPHQHFAKAIFRSIESSSFLVRSANKGISAIINNRGEVIKQLNIDETGNIEMNIPLIRSVYKNKNDLIFLILLFTYLVIFLTF